MPYAIDRYVKETGRLYAVMDKRLSDRDYLEGDYSIVDMAAYPRTVPWERQGQKLDDFPNMKRWWHRRHDRPAVMRAYEAAKPYQSARQNTDPEVTKVLFGQSAATVRR